MSEHTKNYSNLTEMFRAVKEMGKFQKIHNVIRDDYKNLLDITEKNIDSITYFDALYRASLRSLFSLIEADIHSLNQLEEYENYDDKDSFIDRFKRTFKQVAKTWNKEDIQIQYFDSKFKELKKLKTMRDQLIHPKELDHIHSASNQKFTQLLQVFNDYDKFTQDLMNNFFVSTEFKFSE